MPWRKPRGDAAPGVAPRTPAAPGRRPPLLACAWVMLVVLFALGAQFVAPYSPIDIDPRNSLRPPVPAADSSWAHLMGTDRAGRDVASRVIFGAQTDLLIVVVSLLLGGSCGVALGMLAGYVGRWPGAMVMRAVDISLALPTVLLVLAVVAVAGPSFWLVVVATAFVLWARFARLIRAEVVVWREREFVSAARVLGAEDWRILSRHILPNVFNTIVVLATLQMGWIIVLEGSLSFLGAGVPPPTPTWGNMVAEGRQSIETSWWVAAIPGLMISITVLSFNVLGDWLRDRLDPRLRHLA